VRLHHARGAMRFRKRLPLALLAATLAALAGAGIGLFVWLDGVKAAEARQLRSDLETGAGRLHSEIALEFAVITGLLTYALDEKYLLEEKAEKYAPEDEGASGELLRQLMHFVPGVYEKWLEGTRFPDLIDALLLLDAGGTEPVVFSYADTEKRFVPAGEAARDIVGELSIRAEDSGSYRIVLYPDGLALVIPIQRYSVTEWEGKGKRTVHVGDLVAVLDRGYLAREVVAGLFDAYLGSREGRYDFAVVTGGGDELLFSSVSEAGEPEAVVPRRVDLIVPLTAWISSENSLLTDILSAAGEESSLLPQGLLSTRIKDLLIRQWFVVGAARSGAAAGSRAEAPIREAASAGTTRAAESPSGGAEGSRESGSRAAGGSVRSPGIDLYIWHSAGSIEKAARTARNQRLAVSYAVLLSFALVGVIYYLLYRRARDLRDREHEFVATVTHELRTPVSAVNAVADNLAAGIVQDPGQVREYGAAILEHGRRLRSLIDQVLLYAGLSGPARRGRPEPARLDELARRVASAVRGMPKDRLIVHVQPDLPLFGGDPLAVETVIRNLISNAAKHAGRDATVTLSVYREARRSRPFLVIRVSDTGRGIPKRELASVKEPFYRGEASRTEQTPGSGLGLSLVNRVVRTYGGGFSIDSAPGRGTAATVRLPFERGSTDEG